jgi:hypothetical protein
VIITLTKYVRKVKKSLQGHLLLLVVAVILYSSLHPDAGPNNSNRLVGEYEYDFTVSKKFHCETLDPLFQVATKLFVRLVFFQVKRLIRELVVP